MDTINRKPRRSRVGRGFTLIEILVVVVILGIVSAIILPQIGSRDDVKAAAVTRALMADLLYAQNRSIALQKWHYVSFDTTAGTYQVMDSMSPANVITHPVLQAPYKVTIASGSTSTVKLNAVSFDGQTTLAFDVLGVPYSYNSTTGTAALVSGSAVIKCGGNTLTLTVMPFSGEIKIQ